MYGKYTSPIDPTFLLVHSTSTTSCAEQFFQLTQDVNVTKLGPGELFCMAETCEQTRRTPQTVWHVLTSQTQVPVVHIFFRV